MEEGGSHPHSSQLGALAGPQPYGDRNTQATQQRALAASTHLTRGISQGRESQGFQGITNAVMRAQLLSLLLLLLSDMTSLIDPREYS